ncbi:MAG: hypothetical protein OWS74_06710 [Firmicutes bacterium]|nr:hypothetical protein [Bacillota bacterium]
MAVNKVANKETQAVGNLTEEQWKGLSRLGSLIGTLEELLQGPLGSVTVGTLANMSLPTELPEASQHALELLVTLHKDGTLTQLQQLLQMSSSLPEFWNVLSVDKILASADKISDINADGLLELAKEASNAKVLVDMMKVLRYFSEEASPQLVGQITEWIVEWSPKLSNPDVLDTIPSLLNVTVELNKSGLLDLVVQGAQYYKSLISTTEFNMIVSQIVQYLQNTTLIDSVRRIHLESLAELAAEASDPDTAQAMTNLLRLVRLTNNPAIMSELTGQIVKLSSVLPTAELIDAIPDFVETLMAVYKAGLLDQVNQLLGMMEAAKELPWDQIILTVVTLMQKFDVKDVLSKVQEATAETDNETGKLGGIRGLLHIMNSKDTQRLLQFGVNLASKFLPSKN